MSDSLVKATVRLAIATVFNFFALVCLTPSSPSSALSSLLAGRSGSISCPILCVKPYTEAYALNLIYHIWNILLVPSKFCDLTI
eukprot:7782138-Ditylum_brightwellii.AAC.1